MSEHDLVDRAQAVVGDADTIVAAAWFQPRGTSGSIVGGSTLVDGHGWAGAAVDMAAGLAAYGAEKHHDDRLASADGETRAVPFYSMVAVSPKRIYCWKVATHHGHREPGDPIFAYDRDRIAVTVHSRIGVRTFSVEDLDTGVRWEFESPRVEGHLKFVLDALHADQPDADPS
ncbi:MAG: hypothetical protein MUE36_14420 [Acidimicrobiales bacterium]|jgi:hypothetical protein|nr:hypothetical protein [Acidimicrobiales bacterium]